MKEYIAIEAIVLMVSVSTHVRYERKILKLAQKTAQTCVSSDVVLGVSFLKRLTISSISNFHSSLVSFTKISSNVGAHCLMAEAFKPKERIFSAIIG